MWLGVDKGDILTQDNIHILSDDFTSLWVACHVYQRADSTAALSGIIQETDRDKL